MKKRMMSCNETVYIILLTFGFYVFFAGHNNPGGGFIGGLIFSTAFILMFLAFNVEGSLESLPIDSTFNDYWNIGIIYYCDNTYVFWKTIFLSI
ncbi:MnhB domain-containing protein [Staphylococcus aureus]